MKEYLLVFLIGSSWSIFTFYFRTVNEYIKNNKVNKNNCLDSNPYYIYSQYAPLYFGLMSILLIYIKNKFNLSFINSILLIGIVSSIIISFGITYCNFYTFSKQRLHEQYIRLLIAHTLTYTFIFLLYLIIYKTDFE
jgi:hypothetical protein